MQTSVGVVTTASGDVARNGFSRALAWFMGVFILAIALAGIFAPRTAEARQAILDNYMANYPTSKLLPLCGNCHVDWGGGAIGNAQRVDIIIYGVPAATPAAGSQFYLNDAELDGFATGTELTNSQAANPNSPQTRWFPSFPDKDGDGCLQLYNRLGESGNYAASSLNFAGNAYVGAGKGFVGVGPVGWDTDDNDATALAANGNRPAGCSTAWPTTATLGTFDTAGITNDTTPPGAVADLRGSGLVAAAIPLAWTATGDDGTTGTAHSYDLRFTTQTLAAARLLCGAAGSTAAGTSACNVRDPAHWTAMWRDGADAQIANPLGTWNTGLSVAPLMRAVYEPTPSPSGTAQSCTNSLGWSALCTANPGASYVLGAKGPDPTNVITNGSTYWLSLLTSDGVVRPSGTFSAPGTITQQETRSNIIAVTAGTAGAAIQSYSPANPTSGTFTLTLNGLGLNATNAAQVVLTSVAGTAATNGTATGAAITYNAGGLTANFTNVPAGTYNIETRISTGGTTGTRAAYLNAVTVPVSGVKVDSVTSSLADGRYRANQVVPVQVVFSGAVNVTGTPLLTLTTVSPATTNISYASGSGSNILTFNYTVAAGNTSGDLDYAGTGSLTLNGGTINAVTGGSPATLTLPAPGAANSLGANKAIVIDTTAPAAPTISAVATNDIVNAAEKAAGVVISGANIETGATVSVTWGATTKAASVTAPNYTVTFSSAEVPADGNTTVSVTQSDGALPLPGNTSVAGTRAVTIDTVAPASGPAINIVAGDDVVSTAEKTAGVTVTGTNLSGNTVKVYWLGTSGGVLRANALNATAVTATTWSVAFTSAQIPSAGASTVYAFQLDTAANESTDTPRAVTVQGNPGPIFNTPISGDGFINAAEKAAGVIITGSHNNATAVNITFGATTKAATRPTTSTWTVTFTSAEVGADGAKTISGTQVVGGVTSDTTTASVTVDTLAPGAPTINAPICGDNTCNAAEKAAGVAVSGTADTGATVLVTWGATTLSATAPAGTWSVTFSSVQVPADGATTVSATQNDAAGNVGTLAATRPVTVDTLGPSAGIDPVAGDNYVNAAEKAAGVTVTGTTESGATVSVTWGATTKAATVTGTTWSASFAAFQVPADGASTVSAQATDAAGNPGAQSSQAVTVDTVTPVVSATPPSGSYNSAQTLLISADEPATIYYTTNGADPAYPAAGSTMTCAAPCTFAVNGSATYNFFGRDAAGNQSTQDVRSYTVNNVDLVVTPPIVPSATSVVANTNFTINNTVTNQGTTAMATGTSVRFYLSPDATVTGVTGSNDILLGQRTVPALAAGGSSTATTTSVKVPGTVLAGAYYLGAIVDFANTVVESNEGNNTHVNTGVGEMITVLRDIDLIISPPAHPVSVGAGAAFLVNATETNLGTTAMTVASNSVKFYLSPDAIVTGATGSGDILIGTKVVAGYLAAGATSDIVDFSVTVPKTIVLSNNAGTPFYVCAIADATNAQKSETNETNNTQCSTGTISVFKDVDLIMTDVSGFPVWKGANESFPVGSTIKNDGTSPTTASSITIKFYLVPDAATAATGGVEKLLTGSRVASGTLLGAGASSTSTTPTNVTIPSTTLPGNYYVKAVADTTDAQKLETKNFVAAEGNNAFTTTATIEVRRDVNLKITSASTGTTTVSRTAGLNTFNILNTETNLGTTKMTATSNSVKFYLTKDATGATAATSGRLIGQRVVSALAAGISNTADTVVTVPTTMPISAIPADNTYYIAVIADANNAQVESNEGDNVYVLPTTIVVTP